MARKAGSYAAVPLRLTFAGPSCFSRRSAARLVSSDAIRQQHLAVGLRGVERTVGDGQQLLGLCALLRHGDADADPDGGVGPVVQLVRGRSAYR